MSLGPCVSRILNQCPGIIEYIERLQKGKYVQVPKKTAYKRIMVLIGSSSSRNETLAQLHYIDNIFKIFQDFLTSFQSDKPQIHRLYDEIGNLMIKLLLRFVKKESIQNKHVAELPDVDLSKSNQISDSELSIVEDTRKVRKKCSESVQKKCLLGMRSAFAAISSYLQTRLPFKNKLLESLGC